MPNINLVSKNRAPGVTVHKVPGQNRIVGASFSGGGLLGIFKKGPTDKRLTVTDYEGFVERYGDFYNNNYGAPSAKGFFESQGDTLDVSRIVGSGATTAAAPLKSYDGFTNSVIVQALDKGSGFLLEVDTLKASATLTSTVQSGTVSFTVDTINGFEQGDLVQVGGAVVNATAVLVQSINVSTKTVTCLGPSTAGVFTSGTKVYASTRHRVRTTLAENYVSGSSTLKLSNAAGVYPGVRLYISDTANHGSFLVKAVNGNTITLASSVASNITASLSFVVSQEFTAQVYEDGVLVEQRENLSLENLAAASNNIDHVETRLMGSSNESYRISMDDQEADLSVGGGSHLTNFKDIAALPVTFTRVPLTGGNDGATPTVSDWIGSSVVGSETGLYLFNSTNDVRFIAAPGQTDPVFEKAASDYVEFNPNKGNCEYVGEIPLTSLSTDASIAYRNITLAKNTSFMVLLRDWFMIDHPTVSKGTFVIPPAGYWMGRASASAATNGIKQPPAGVEDGVLPASVKGLVSPITDEQHALLDGAGIICTRFTDTFGFHFFGAKTLTSIFNGFEWYNVQALYNFIAASLKEAGKPYVFKPNNETTREKLRTAIERFMESLFKNGEFIPQDNPSEAFYVKCDDENNTLDIINTGNLVCDVGFNPPTPAAFINFRVGRMNGSVTVTNTQA